MNRNSFLHCVAVSLLFGLTGFSAMAADISDLDLGMEPDPALGYRLILTEPMAAPVMRETDPEYLWKIWEPEEKAKVEGASAEEIRRLTFQRYGWAKRLEEGATLPLGYTPDGKGNLVTNCFVCHGGRVNGVTTPGAGNTHLDLTTLATDVQRLRTFESGGDPAKVSESKAPFGTPLNFHKGTTNAVIFAPVFAALRDPKLAMEYMKDPSLLHHHDMNAPAWWMLSRKEKIYCDAFAPKTPRQLMPFAMSPTFSDEKFRSFEPNFVHIKAYIESLEPPKYPFDIDRALAAKGKVAFDRVCSDCHGTYGDGSAFPGKVVEWDRVGTDEVRLSSIALERREATNRGWLQYDGEHPVDLESEGYLAQPLDGVWASAPYFHNGSVPTLYHVFNVDERPKVWKRLDDTYDSTRVGLDVETFDAVPGNLSGRQQRQYFDTGRPGASNAGHTFPDDELTPEEKVAVLEYLKTL